jgi:hypothetical protein
MDDPPYVPIDHHTLYPSSLALALSARVSRPPSCEYQHAASTRPRVALLPMPYTGTAGEHPPTTRDTPRSDPREMGRCCDGRRTRVWFASCPCTVGYV